MGVLTGEDIDQRHREGEPPGIGKGPCHSYKGSLTAAGSVVSSGIGSQDGQLKEGGPCVQELGEPISRQHAAIGDEIDSRLEIEALAQGSDQGHEVVAQAGLATCEGQSFGANLSQHAAEESEQIFGRWLWSGRRGQGCVPDIITMSALVIAQ